MALQIEIWFQDEARVGQQGTHAYIWATIGARPLMVRGNRHDSAYVVPFFSFPPTIRKMIYTTNAVESLNWSLRKVIKTRGSFPSNEAALKLLYTALNGRPTCWAALEAGHRLAGSEATVHDFVF